MRQIRNGVFETNSSSTHSLTVCTQEEFDKWVNGELIFDSWDDCIVKYEELSNEEKEDAKDEYNKRKLTYWKDWEQLSEEQVQSWYANYQSMYLKKRSHHGLQTYDEWCKDYSLEHFSEHFTSPSGDKMVVFGKYGYDG